MTDLLRALFNPAFMPHGHCYFWTPAMVWAQAGSNFFIGLAYMSISATLVYMVRRIRDIPFQWVYLAFGVFIVTCGFTHFLDIVTIWRPIYWVDASVRVVTALASLGTAVLLFPLVPKVIGLSETARLAHDRGIKLEEVNRELKALYEGTREALAEAIPQLVWTTQPDGTVESMNVRWAEYSGRTRSVGDWAPADLAHPDDRPAFLERWQQSLRTGEAFEMELRLRRRDGVYRWHLGRALPLRQEGQVVRWFGTFTDIDDHKRAAEERERLVRELQDAVQAR